MAWLLPEPPPWLPGEWLLLLLFVALGAGYVVYLPSFEGPDEPEHARYVQALAEGATIHPVPEEARLRWGFQVHHPPLYYRLAGTVASFAELRFPDALVLNPAQNPHVPFIRHDLPGHRFPFDAVGRSLRALRLLSLLFGVGTFLVLRRIFALLFPEEPASRLFLLAASMLAPNTLQIFSTVSNDGLSLLFASALLLVAIAIVRSREPAPAAFALAGACAGLAVLAKLTGLAAVAVAGSLWLLDALFAGRVRAYAWSLLCFFAPVFLLLVGPFFVQNVFWYGDPTRESLLQALTPAYHLAEARTLAEVLGLIAVHLPLQLAADLGWQTVRFGLLSAALFWPALVAVLLSGVFAWRQRDASGRRAVEWLIPILSLAWGLVLLVVANRSWTNLQIRHVWCLAPFLLIGVADALRRLPAPIRARGRAAAAGAIAALVLLNAAVALRFHGFYAPGPGTLLDRDYRTFLYTHARDPQGAREYLRHGRSRVGPSLP
ncbi:MAG: hypothetical protein ACR2P8_09235 [Myxococcota bacterium]